MKWTVRVTPVNARKAWIRTIGLAALVIGLILAGEGVFFYRLIAGRGEQRGGSPFDAVIVFTGQEDRILKGYALCIEHGIPYLILSPADRETIDLYSAALDFPLTVTPLLEDRSQTTFESALQSSKIVKEKEIKSILLVTSDFHLPRSFIILKSLLVCSGTRIETATVDNLTALSRRNRFKLLYNEMLKLWGSFAEMAHHRLTGHFPEKRLKESRFVLWLKKTLLLELNDRLGAT